MTELAATAPVPADSSKLRSAAHLATEEVVVLDYGGQYSQLIARRIRDCGVFSELLPHSVPLEEVARRKPRAIVLSGGPRRCMRRARRSSIWACWSWACR